MRTASPTERSIFTARFVHCFVMVVWLVSPPATASVTEVEDLAEMSIEELMNIEVTSVSKRAQKISEIPAAITVLSAEDIRRSGATNIPEALRMVPGLHVAHIDNNNWAITARGFNNIYANKLLVMIDGRTVYNPLFAGVHWEVRDVVLEDIDRIEVIRGPGGTIWGANAVNGVINIITKKSEDTAGAMLSAGGGSVEDGIVSFRYGRSLGDDVHARVYGKYLHTDTFDPPYSGGPVNDARRIGRTGFRVDWDATEDNTVTFQGDYFQGESDIYQELLSGQFPGTPEGDREADVRGANFIARLQSAFSEDSDFSAQLYYDRTDRWSTPLEEYRNTVDLDLQYDYAGLPRQHLTLGAGYRVIWEKTERGTETGLGFDPSNSTDHLVSGFLQDEIAVLPDLLALTVGSKFEYNEFSGFEFQPSLRVLWTPHPRHTVWGAASRAVRTPARNDRDLDLDFDILVDTPFGPMPANVRFVGDKGVDAEDLLAVELGYRAQPHDRVSFDVAAYFNKYDDLMTYETVTVDPATCGALGYAICQWTDRANKLDGIGWGVEASGTWAVFDFWKLMASYTYMALDLEPEAGSTATDAEEDSTPLHQFQIRSQLDLPWNLEADAMLYYVGEVKARGIDSYPRVDLRLGWRPRENFELSVLGRNLQERRHNEWTSGIFNTNSSVPRSVFAKLVLHY